MDLDEKKCINHIKKYSSLLESQFDNLIKTRNKIISIKGSQKYCDTIIFEYYMRTYFNKYFEKYKNEQRAGIILLDNFNKTVLVKGNISQKFGFPKGGVNKNENLLDGAFRELYEETNINLNKIVNKELINIKNLVHATFFVFKINKIPNIKVNDTKEIEKAIIINIDDINKIKNTTSDIKVFIKQQNKILLKK